MRRRLPPPDGGRAAKRHKAGGEGAPAAANGGRFDYGAPKDLDSGAFVGFLLTCPIQR